MGEREQRGKVKRGERSYGSWNRREDWSGDKTIRGGKGNKVGRRASVGEASNSVRHSAQPPAALSKVPRRRNVIIFPSQSR